MASVVKDIPVSQDNNNNNNNNTDEDNKDLTKLGQRAQTDYTKFDRVEDVPENETALEIALKLRDL